jgi:hypothetical protein
MEMGRISAHPLTLILCCVIWVYVVWVWDLSWLRVLSSPPACRAYLSAYVRASRRTARRLHRYRLYNII